MLDHAEPFSEALGGPIMAQNNTKNSPLWPNLAIHDPKWPCMTPNGPKTLPMDILHDYMPYWTTLGPFQRPQGVQKLPKTSPSWPNISPKLIFMTPNVPTWPQIAQIHFPWVYYMILCHVGPPWGLFRGPLGPRWPLNRPQGGPIWHIIMYYAPAKCLRAILGHAGTFWVMKGYFGSWSFFIAPPFWVMNGHFWSWRAIMVLFWAIFGPPWASAKAPGLSNMTKYHATYP